MAVPAHVAPTALNGVNDRCQSERPHRCFEWAASNQLLQRMISM